METLPFSVYDVVDIPSEPEKKVEHVDPAPHSPNTERILKAPTLILGESGDDSAKSPLHPAMPEKPASAPAASDSTPEMPEVRGESGGSKVEAAIPPFDAFNEQEFPTNRIKHQVDQLVSAVTCKLVSCIGFSERLQKKWLIETALSSIKRSNVCTKFPLQAFVLYMRKIEI